MDLKEFLGAWMGRKFLMWVITSKISGYKKVLIPPSKIVTFTISIIILPILFDMSFSFCK